MPYSAIRVDFQLTLMTYVPEKKDLISRHLARVRSKANHVKKRLLQPLRNPRRKSRAAFLVGCGRSGTDLYAAKLSQPTDALLINEDNPAGFENWRLKDLETLKALVQGSFAKVVLFKPIVETYRIRELLGAFPDSRSIFITRGYSDTVNSIVSFFGEGTRRAVRKWIETDFSVVRTWSVPESVIRASEEVYHDKLTLEDAAGIYWFVYNSSYHALGLDQDPRVGLFRYEDLINRPENTLKAACGHLGLPFHPGMPSGIFPSSVGKRAAPELADEIKARCEEVQHQLLKDLRSGSGIETLGGSSLA